MVSSFSSLSGHREGGFSDTNLQEVHIELIRPKQWVSEGRFELKLITKVFQGQEFAVLLKEILDSYYILIKPTFVEYRFTVNFFFVIPNYIFISKPHFL